MEKGNQPDNIKKAYRTAYLVAGFLKQSLTESEKQELDNWLNESEHNKKLFAELTNQEKLQEKLTEYNQTDTEYYLQKAKEGLNFDSRRKKTQLWKYGVAASIIACLVAVWIAKPFSGKQTVIAVQGPDTISNRGAQPEQEQVTLTMGDGKTVLLGETLTDSAINNQLLINDGKELVYQKEYGDTGFHTLTVPRKSFYHLRLPDGTKVSLNASSSLRYPTRFTGNERRVYMTGEGYFEVAPNTAQPFRVEAAIKDGPLVVEAVGTAFNVNAYTDEPAPAATLVEGKVNVSLSGKETVHLVPNQQARATNNGLKVVPGNVDVITAWTKNQFLFDDTPLDEVFRQFARWYNVEFVYDDLPNELIHLPINRTLPIEDVLRVLGKTGKFRYTTDGQRITITK
jgi:transmembrane sensor